MQQDDIAGVGQSNATVLGCFEDALNRHGYSFQYSALNAAKDALVAGVSPWRFVASEVPVQIHGRDTRVDFVLEHGELPRHLVVECKRANPALSNWCFVRAPFVVRNDRSATLILDAIEANGQLRVSGSLAGERPYHIALEVRADKKGDPQGGRSDAIESAVAQACQGMNGYIDLLMSRRQLWERKRAAYVMPVVFTTARLFSSDADLARADLTNGELSLAGSRLVEMPWVIYQYHQSHSLRHGHYAESIQIEPDLPRMMRMEAMRTIPIVSASGIEEFLRWAGDVDLQGF